MIGYIYGLFDSSKSTDIEECRYIGLTRRTLKSRLRSHLDSAKHENNPRTSWIKGVINNSNQVVILPLEMCESTSQDDLNALLQDREIAWIADGRSRGWRLTNATDGGDGVTGHSPSLEVRQRLSVACSGWKHTPEARAKIAAARALQGNPMKGRKHTPETRAKMSASHRSRLDSA